MMICDSCGKEYDEIIPFCPFCGTRRDDTEPIDISSGRDEDTDDNGVAESDSEPQSEEDRDMWSVSRREEGTLPDEVDGTSSVSCEKNGDDTLFEPEVRIVPDTEEEVTERSRKVALKKKIQSNPARNGVETPGEKRAKNAVVCIVSIMAVLLCVISAVGLSTDIFKSDDGIKAVALLGLSVQEETELETYFSEIGPVLHKDFDGETISCEEFLDIIGVGSEKELFAALGNKADMIREEADPVVRFTAPEDETDEYDYYSDTEKYAYYRVDADVIDEILLSFGIPVNHTINSDRVYFYKDSYYFASVQEESNSPVGVKFDIKESKRIQDGGYYIDCSVLDSAGTEIDKVYIVAEKTENSTEWTIKKVTHEPMFDSLGIMVKGKEDYYTYEMKTETFKGITKDGKVFCNYVIEYPVFSGNSPGEQAANEIYQNLIISYKAEAEDATRSYKSFVKNGYDESDLPKQIYIRGDVTYNREKYVSVVNEIAQTPLTKPANEATGESEVIILAQRSYEGYIFGMESGEFISKDAIIGKDYVKIAELIYRIKKGYNYTSVITGVEDVTYVPKDEEEIGLKFYEGAAALCSDGFTFFAADERGVGENVVIPYGIMGVFSETF